MSDVSKFCLKMFEFYGYFFRKALLQLIVFRFQSIIIFLDHRPQIFPPYIRTNNIFFIMIFLKFGVFHLIMLDYMAVRQLIYVQKESIDLQFTDYSLYSKNRQEWLQWINPFILIILIEYRNLKMDSFIKSIKTSGQKQQLEKTLLNTNFLISLQSLPFEDQLVIMKQGPSQFTTIIKKINETLQIMNDISKILQNESRVLFYYEKNNRLTNIVEFYIIKDSGQMFITNTNGCVVDLLLQTNRNLNTNKCCSPKKLEKSLYADLLENIYLFKLIQQMLIHQSFIKH